MATGTVYVKGLRELQRDLKKLEKETPKEIDRGLKEAGDVVRDDARPRLARYDARSAAGLRTRTRGFGQVSVEQRLGKTTGQHPEFGVLIMQRALIPALTDNQEEVVRKVDAIIGKLAGETGF